MAQKFKPTEDQIDYLRTVWREKNPEEAARRARKRKSGQPDYERDEDENTTDAPVITMTEQESAEVRKEMLAFWHYLYDRRHEYLVHRNLEQAALTDEEKQQFKEYILRYEGISGFTMETENLLIDGLKYPEKDNDLANFCFKYLADKYAKGAEPSMAMWIQLWNRDFVPLDAVRLMLRHDIESGTYSKNNKFETVFPMLVNKIKKHRDKEELRLAAAREAEREHPGSGGIATGRRARRLFFFNILLRVYGADRKG